MTEIEPMLDYEEQIQIMGERKDKLIVLYFLSFNDVGIQSEVWEI